MTSHNKKLLNQTNNYYAETRKPHQGTDLSKSILLLIKQIQKKSQISVKTNKYKIKTRITCS